MPRRRSGERMPMTSLHLTKEMLEGLDWLVQKGLYPNRSEAIRAAVLALLLSTGSPKAEKEREEEEDGLHVLRGR